MKGVNRVTQTFLRSVVAILILTAAAKLWSVTGDAKLLSTEDPVVHLTYRKLMLLVGVIELAVAWYLWKGRSVLMGATAVFWLASNFMLYRFASSYLKVSMCPCLGTLTSNLPITKAQADQILTWTVLYLWFGSGLILLQAWSRAAGPPTSGTRPAELVQIEPREIAAAG